MIGIPIGLALKLMNPGVQMLKSILNLFLLYYLLWYLIDNVRGGVYGGGSERQLIAFPTFGLMVGGGTRIYLSDRD